MAFTNDTDEYDYLFKIVLIGDAGVGKTGVVQRFKTGHWIESQGSTIGVDFCMKTVDVEDKKIKLQVWDTAGQERFRTITQSYYRSANAVLCAFDISRELSFYNVSHWMEDVQKYCAPYAIKLLIGTKSDLETQRAVTVDEASKHCEYWGMLDYIETSAKENRNINNVFYRLAQELLKQHVDLSFSNDKAINLSDSKAVKTWTCC